MWGGISLWVFKNIFIYLFICLCWVLVVAGELCCPVACGILVLWPGIKPTFPALEVDSYPLDHWKSPSLLFLFAFLQWLGFSGSSVGKESTCSVGDLADASSSLGWEDPLEEGMATHSSILAWRIPWAEEPGGLQSIGLQRIGHDWVTKHTHSQQLVMLSTLCAFHQLYEV